MWICYAWFSLITPAELSALTSSLLRGDMSCELFEPAPPGIIVLWFTCSCKFEQKTKQKQIWLYSCLFVKNITKKKINIIRSSPSLTFLIKMQCNLIFNLYNCNAIRLLVIKWQMQSYRWGYSCIVIISIEFFDHCFCDSVIYHIIDE